MTGGYWTTNSGSVTTITTGCRMRTWRHFQMPSQQAPIYVEFVAAFSNTFVTNTTIDFGLFIDSGSNPFTPTDGVYFRATSAGLEGVCNYNGVEVTTGPMLVAPAGAAWSPTNNANYQFLISITNREVKFWIDDVLYGSIDIEAANIAPAASLELPLAVRHAIAGGAASAALQFKVASYSVQVGDVERDKPCGATMSAMGNGLQVQQGATTGGQLTTYAIGAAPTAVTLTANTGPATNTLGGLYLLPAAITAGESDYPMFAWQNPQARPQSRARHSIAQASSLATRLFPLRSRVVALGSTGRSGSAQRPLAGDHGSGQLRQQHDQDCAQAAVGRGAVVCGHGGSRSYGSRATDHLPDKHRRQSRRYLHIIMRAIGTSTSAGGIRGSITVLGYFE